MKKLVYLFVIASTICGIQEAVSQEINTINVVGRAELNRTVSAYRAKIVLSMDQIIYSNPECIDLESFKDKYFTLLREKGIDPTKFTENKLAFTSYGYQKAGTVYDYETTQLDEIEALTANKMNGVQVTVQYKTIITESQKETFLKKAFENALENAELLCKVANKKLGSVLSISETSLNTEIWNGYYNDLTEYVNVYVSYEIE